MTIPGSNFAVLDLAQHYDPERKISYDPVKEPNLHSEELQWLFFAHGGVGPMYVPSRCHV